LIARASLAAPRSDADTTPCRMRGPGV